MRYFYLSYIRLMRRLAVSVLLGCLCSLAFAQSKLSPNLEMSGEGRLEMTTEERFAIKVKSSMDFLKLYSDRITVLHRHKSSGTYTIIARPNLIMNEMLEDENVLFIDIRQLPNEESVLSYPDFRFNRIRKAQNNYPKADGDELVVSVKERRFDPDDIDLRGKSVELGFEGKSVSGHATEMATIIAGVGNTSPLFKGISTKAMLSSSDFTNLLPDEEQILVENNIFVQNHAYGVDIENYYGVDAAAYDQSVFNEPNLLHVFSVGNSGKSSPEHGTYANLPFANLTGNFKHAKNVLTVSAVDTAYNISEFNSRGPAYDGRLKPELTAYGGLGTSDAAAIASGVSTMLQDAFSDKTGSVPSAALIRAFLIAGADDVGFEGIDFYTGYGSINAYQSLQVLENGWYTEAALLKDETLNVNLNVPEGVSTLRIAVTWTDPPAEVNSKRALVNDVDATFAFEDEIWLPWVLNNDASETALNAPPTRREDHLNNTEFFTLLTPQEGTYTLNLDGKFLTTESQKVYLSWFYEFSNQLDWDFPTSSDILKSGTKERIHWSSTFEKSTGELFYQIGGGEWVSLGSVDLNGFYEWQVPDTSAIAKLKMTISEKDFLSGLFLISEVPEVSVAFNCEDLIGLQWQQIEEVTSYQIFEMGELELNLIGETDDTVFTMEKTDRIYYAVLPLLAEQEGMRSRSLNLNFQGALCYINFFAAERLDEESVRVRLNLSSAFQIEKIEILKSYSLAQDEVFAEFAPAGQTNFTFLDTALHPGTMFYEAVLHFEDGSTRVSDPSSIFIEKKGEVILFPNPTVENFINILTPGTGQKIQILDRTGKILFEKELYSQVDLVQLDHFRAGLYLYRLLEKGRVIDEGKFIKY